MLQHLDGLVECPRHIQCLLDRVALVGIQTQDRQQYDAGRAFMDQFGLSFPNGMDDASAVSVEWGLFGVPETYFINRDGTVEYRLVGPVTAAVLDEQLAAILR